jgi:hypothetical protein
LLALLKGGEQVTGNKTEGGLTALCYYSSYEISGGNIKLEL